MAKAKRLPSGNYRTRVHIGGGKYKSFTAPTKKESEYMASQYLMHNYKSDVSDMYITDVVKKYIEIKTDSLSPTTIRTYKGYLKNQIQLLKNVKVKMFDRKTHQKWIDDIKKTMAPKSVFNINGLLVGALNYFHIRLDPVTLPQKEYKEILVPTTEEVKMFIDYFENKNKEMVKAIYLASTGTLRRGEICALKGEDVNRKNNTITVKHSMVYGLDRKTVIKQPKTYSSNRTIKLPKFIIDMLPDDDYVVKLKPDTITEYFINARIELGLPPYTFHSLRHYSASIMHANNIPTQYIMERGGWTSEHTLNRIYRNSLKDYQKKFTDQTNEYFEDNLK